MQVIVAAFGRLKGPEAEICARYDKRIRQTGKQAGISSLVLTELSESRLKNADQRKQAEADLLRQKIPDDSYIIALDERGRNIASQELADKTDWLVEAGRPTMVFVIGGPDGLDERFRQQTDLCLSMGKMTLPHGLARAILFEQIYRSITILQGHPYHRS